MGTRMLQTYLEKLDPPNNAARFYRMAVLPNLFGEWTLYREWGRIGQGGQVRLDCYEHESQAVAALMALEASKRARGYWAEPQQRTMFD
ncbi:WGR domain protein [Labrenzia sp. THAF82]|uniref:WGR domain-containing protein n=1 Tax=Labrenzia sp. THAF82 TaxID=2587861 RepID=UPI0012A981E3|nr:WGR domain-containing protein [Labrenzia sp. THAF82]QFT29418.1 WGR domain protein [Labrenzia sp. THAF82]QFT29527.1 WGR domain protein [Labrenzia sp. THAF82]